MLESMTDEEILLVLQELRKIPAEAGIEKMRKFARAYEIRERSVRNSRRSGTGYRKKSRMERV
jgi:hypothetical protein